MKHVEEQIKQRYAFYVQKRGGKTTIFPYAFGASLDDGRPHVEIHDNGQLFFAYFERGACQTIFAAADVEDFLYQLFRDDALAFARQKHARVDDETRKVAITTTVSKELRRMSAAWEERFRNELIG